MTPSERRTVMIALAVVVPSLSWVFAVKPVRAALAEANDRIAVERDALAREQGAILEASRNPARKRVADSAVAAANARVFTGANEVAAGGTLVTYLGEVARRTNVWLASASTRTAAATTGRGSTAAPAARTSAAGGRGATSAPALPDGLTALRVELRAESDFQGVLEFLGALERGEKVVTVERLDIARVLRAGDEDRETLAVTATVVGYALAGARSADGASGAPSVDGRRATP